MIAIPKQEPRLMRVQVFYLPTIADGLQCGFDYKNRRLLEQATVRSVGEANDLLLVYSPDCPENHVMMISLEGPGCEYWVEGLADGKY